MQKALNSYLADYPYLDGYTPSQLDSSVHRSLMKSNVDLAMHPHVKRWCNHIATFTDEERAAFRPEQSKIIPKLACVEEHQRADSNNSFQVNLIYKYNLIYEEYIRY